MRNIKLIIEYDGTNYYGWQKQPNYTSVQGEIEKAIEIITREKIKLNGAGRTDKGVHAKGQVASFCTNSSIPSDKFKFALNSVLPRDIAIKESSDMKQEFHARYNAIGKQYKYVVYNNRIRSALYKNYSYHIPYELDINKIIKAKSYFLGTHDFTSFSSTQTTVKNKIRTIHNIDINKINDIIEMNVRGNGFLYNMVRIIVGTLIEVGSNRINIDELKGIMELKNRCNAGHTAPPQGLYLEKVFYKD